MPQACCEVLETLRAHRWDVLKELTGGLYSGEEQSLLWAELLPSRFESFGPQVPSGSALLSSAAPVILKEPCKADAHFI